jgi:opacity protein-like surface antigen
MVPPRGGANRNTAGVFARECCEFRNDELWAPRLLPDLGHTNFPLSATVARKQEATPMKRIVPAAVLAATLLTAGAASAEDSSWYVQANGMAGFNSNLPATPDRAGKPGWGLTGQVGRDFGNGWRTDAEVLYLDSGNRFGEGGRTSLTGGFVNGYYNFNHGRAWQPFVGGGVGVADVRSIGEADTRFAWQVKAGLDHPFTDRLIGEVAYRYIGVPDAHAGIEPNGFRGDYHSSAMTVGVRIRF